MVFLICSTFSSWCFKNYIRISSEYICNICVELLSGKAKNNCNMEKKIHSDWVLHKIFPLEVTACTLGSGTFHLQRREEGEEMHIKFLWSCSSSNIYVLHSCFSYVEQAISNAEIANKSGIPQGLLNSQRSEMNRFVICFLTSVLS